MTPAVIIFVSPNSKYVWFHVAFIIQKISGVYSRNNLILMQSVLESCSILFIKKVDLFMYLKIRVTENEGENRSFIY